MLEMQPFRIVQAIRQLMEVTDNVKTLSPAQAKAENEHYQELPFIICTLDLAAKTWIQDLGRRMNHSKIDDSIASMTKPEAREFCDSVILPIEQVQNDLIRLKLEGAKQQKILLDAVLECAHYYADSNEQLISRLVDQESVSTQEEAASLVRKTATF